MIRLISVKCPDCGAALQFEEGRQTAFCSYCGDSVSSDEWHPQEASVVIAYHGFPDI